MTYEFDLIIIGSGAGGGTVASRLAPLAKAGAKIAILESGPYYTKEYLTQREIEMTGLFRNAGAWPTKDGAITISMGQAVGGSTLMYTGVTFRLPDDVCEDWNVPGLTADDLRPRFDVLEKEIHVIEPDEDMMNDNNRLFKEACEKLDIPYEKIPLNVDQCEQMGFCNLGCAKGHKQGTLAVQLPVAEAAGITIVPNCTVTRIGDKTLDAVIGDTPPGTKPGPYPPGQVQFKANRVVVAGGTAGSPALLMRSGFEKEFPALGKYITLHPALTVYGIYPEKIKNYKGFPKIFYTGAYSESHDHYLETAFYYPFITTKNLGLWGSQLTSVMQRYDQLMCMIILVHDKPKATNKLVLDKTGEAVLEYTVDDHVLDSLVSAQQHATEIFEAAGCDEFVMPSAKERLFSSSDIKNGGLQNFISRKYTLLNKIPIASAHLQGGCKMGADKNDSVCNSRGKVHGYDWLYVADGSLFPKSSHVNPYLTIMALADRVSEELIETKGSWL